MGKLYRRAAVNEKCCVDVLRTITPGGFYRIDTWELSTVV